MGKRLNDFQPDHLPGLRHLGTELVPGKRYRCIAVFRAKEDREQIPHRVFFFFLAQKPIRRGSPVVFFSSFLVCRVPAGVRITILGHVSHPRVLCNDRMSFETARAKVAQYDAALASPLSDEPAGSLRSVRPDLR